MPVEIKSSSFCGLSRAKDWQNWLKNVAPDLHKDLLKVVDSGKGCRANSNKMMDIYFTLHKRGLEPQLETFLKRRFPWIIKPPEEPTRKQIRKKVNKVKAAEANRPRKHMNWETINKHNVFLSYRPDILSFPQKHIIIADPKFIYDQVQSFVANKLAVDYLIIDDHAYIEYFEPKYVAVVARIPREARDIYKYRIKMLQDAD
jgi:hypothetical protein